MKRILLLRHGRTEANDRWLYCGSTDLPLSERGKAELLAKKNRAQTVDLSDFQVYISPMLRARETLSLLWGVTGVEVPGLREMDFGIFEMKSYEQLKDTEEFRRWCSGDNERNCCPGGESGEQMRERVLKAFRQLISEHDRLLLVFHGGPIAAVMEALFPREGKNRYDWQPKNGSGYEVFIDADKAVCYNTFLE